MRGTTTSPTRAVAVKERVRLEDGGARRDKCTDNAETRRPEALRDSFGDVHGGNDRADPCPHSIVVLHVDAMLLQVSAVEPELGRKDVNRCPLPCRYRREHMLHEFDRHAHTPPEI